MTPRQSLLKRARQVIEDDQQTYICYAIGQVARPNEQQKARELRQELMDAIEAEDPECVDLGSMVRYVYGQPLTYDQAQLCRLAWIDKLLETP